MSYSPETIVIPTGLDEIGLNLGLTRLLTESLGDFQRRLTLETNQRSGPTQREFINSISRRVGLFDTPVFAIDLVRVSNESTAVDPFVEITSGALRLYSDYANSVVDTEVLFSDRTNGYFLSDLVSALATSTYFTVSALAEGFELERSYYLRYSSSRTHIVSELLNASHENKLAHSLLSAIYPNARNVFVREVANLADLSVDGVQSGDYFVDYTNGVLYSHEVQGGFISYDYNVFPFTAYYQPVKAWPYLDADKSYALYDTLISDDTDLPIHTLLNSQGAAIANNVLAIHPLCWGS